MAKKKISIKSLLAMLAIAGAIGIPASLILFNIAFSPTYVEFNSSVTPEDGSFVSKELLIALNLSSTKTKSVKQVVLVINNTAYPLGKNFKAKIPKDYYVGKINYSLMVFYTSGKPVTTRVRSAEFKS